MKTIDDLLDRLKEVYPRSFLAEFMEVFGRKNTRMLIDVFSGTTLEIPTRKTLEITGRDIAIYEELCLATSFSLARKQEEKLADKYNLSKHRVHEIYKMMCKQMRENRRFKMEDVRVGKLKKSRVKVEHRSKRKL